MKYLILILLFITYTPEAKEGKSHVKSCSCRLLKNQKLQTNSSITNEIDLYKGAITENIQTVKEMSNRINISASLVNFDFLNLSHSNYRGSLFLGLEKAFLVKENISLVLGSQLGIPLVNAPRSLYNYTYLQIHYSYLDNSFYVGNYYGNASITQTVKVIGYLVGFEIVLPYDFKLRSDFISGKNNLSGEAISLNYSFSSHVIIGIGGLLPTPHSGNQQGIFLTLSYY